MPMNRRLWCCLLLLALVLGLTVFLPQAQAYVEAPYTLGRVIAESTGAVVLMRVEKVDKQNNIVFYRKVRSAARSSSENSCGSCQAAKCPPRSTSL